MSFVSGPEMSPVRLMVCLPIHQVLGKAWDRGSSFNIKLGLLMPYLVDTLEHFLDFIFSLASCVFLCHCHMILGWGLTLKEIG